MPNDGSAMRKEYGSDHAHKCKDCVNLIHHERERRWYKCVAYGLSHSASSDWRVSNTACGLWGVPFETTGRKPLKDALTRSQQPTEQLEGQLAMGLEAGG